MDDSRCPTPEKEPFLLGLPANIHRRKAWSPRLVAAFWSAGHILLFTILGGILVLTVRDTIIKTNGMPSSLQKRTEFGGLPVQYDDPQGPYVICPSTGGAAAARKAGCGFDLFANGWAPGPCFDAEKHDYFVNQRDYYFWEDKAKNHRVHQDKLLEGNLEYPELFVSFEEHYEHCRYLLNGTKRYAHNPTLGVLDIHMDEEHMNHCIDFLKESRDPYNLEEGVIAYFGHRKCFLPRSDTNSEL